MATPYPVVGGAVALAGADKIFGDRAYRSMFQTLGWSEDEMHRAALAEMVGGLMMMWRPSRRLGAAIVIAVSATILRAELAKGEVQLAASRSAVALAALAALVNPG